MSEQTRHVSPLFNFSCKAPFRVANDLMIAEQCESLDLSRQLETLWEIERVNCDTAKRWLILDRDGCDALSESEIMNLFLVSLWIVREGTPAHLAFRFVPGQPTRAVRLLDRFRRVGDHGGTTLSDLELNRVSSCLAALRRMVKVSPRIKAAASLTLAGCMAHLWQVAFMCFGSAAEALLFYQDGPGQTERLRFAYASLVAQDEDQKQILRRDFGRLYKLRCEIVHKGAYWRDDGGTNLGDLAELENLLRRLWRAILDSQTISDALQGDDRIRHALFEQRQGLPPARTRRCCL